MSGEVREQTDLAACSGLDSQVRTEGSVPGWLGTPWGNCPLSPLWSPDGR